MSEALRRTKMAESEVINDYRRHFAFNYLIGAFLNKGLLISGAALTFIGNTSQHMSTGVPYYYRPKMLYQSPRFYN